MRVPFGVKLLGGFFLVLSGSTVYQFYLRWTGIHDGSWHPSTGSLAMPMTVFDLALCPVEIATGIALLKLKDWGRWLAGFYLIGNLVESTALHLFSGGALSSLIPDLMLSFVFSLLVIAYLLRPSVKAQFISKTTNR